MSQAKAQLLMVKGMLSEMPPEQQAKVADLKQRMAALVRESPLEGSLALGLVALEAEIDPKSFGLPE